MKNKNSFTVGQWVFCSFELQQITSMEDGRVTGVTNGFLQGSSYSLTCFPMDMRVKILSDNFEDSMRKLHREGGINLNFPDMKRHLEQQWEAACSAKDDTEAVNKAIKDLDLWTAEILHKVEDIKRETIGGVRVFR